MMKAKSSVSRSPMRPAVPPSVAEELAPPPPSIAPTIAPTMPLRIRPAPSAASQPKITLSQLVPRSSLPPRCASREPCPSPRGSCSSRSAPTRLGPSSREPSILCPSASMSGPSGRRFSASRCAPSCLPYLSLMRFSLKRGRARSLPGTSALVDTCWASLPAATPRLVVKVRAAASATRGGRVFDVDLFLADILLDDLLVLDHVLANPQLFLDHRTLLDHDLFL